MITLIVIVNPHRNGNALARMLRSLHHIDPKLVLNVSGTEGVADKFHNRVHTVCISSVGGHNLGFEYLAEVNRVFKLNKRIIGWNVVRFYQCLHDHHAHPDYNRGDYE